MTIMLDELISKGYHIYFDSISCSEETQCAIVQKNKVKYLAVKGAKSNLFEGVFDGTVMICSLSVKNAQILHELFPYTKPCRLPPKGISIGLGDRLGLSTPGHTRAIKATHVFPVFAQQSIRELNLTNRTFMDVVSAATYGVFEAGYKGGYAADGDHLKSIKEIEYALSGGCTLITLDCSEYIYERYLGADKKTVDEDYQLIPLPTREYYERKYLHHIFPIVGEYSELELRRLVLTFMKAIHHVESCWEFINAYPSSDVDIELSVDETAISTSPSAHFFIALELISKGVHLWSCAPRFHGKFEKGIDYIGDINKFEVDFRKHQKIAEYYGYKLSVHSGSDKYSIYPIISREAPCNIHIKTSGTSWLESLRLVSCHNQTLFCLIYNHARKCFSQAQRLYDVSTCLDNIPIWADINYNGLHLIFDCASVRQLLHITYGYILSEKYLSLGITETIFSFEDEYYACLEKHITKHLESFLHEK